MRKIILLVAFLSFIGMQAFAQTTITGTVTDTNGEPVPGATVSAKGFSNVGTMTDLNGSYSLSVPADATTLIFSFVGMKRQEVKIGGRTTINVTMENEDIGINEVVVTGYAVKRKKVTSSAVSTVSSDELADMVPITSVDNMLQGKAAGVDVSALNGKPGATGIIKIRGAVSLNTTGGDKSQPLYVIDGVFLDKEDMNSLNASDIESISILKDAAAAAIYGSRAANGVVVITTKRGKKDQKSVITYNGRYGTASKIEDPYEMMNSAEKIAYEEAAGIPWSDEDKAYYMQFDHNWQDDILKTSTIMSHSLSARGGSENTSYFISGSYDENTGIIQYLDGFQRVTGRLNLNSKLTDKLNLGITTNVSQTSSDEPRDRNNVQNPFRAMYDYNPFTPVYQYDNNGDLILDDNGDPIYNLTRQGFPILEALQRNPENEKYTYIIASAVIEYQIIENLKFSSKYSNSYRRYRREYYMMPNSVLNGYVGDPAAPGSKTDSGSDTYSFSWLNKLSYSKTFGRNNLSVSAFTEYYKRTYEYYRLSSKGYASPLLTTQDNSSEATAASSTKRESALFTIAGFADYDYDGKYLASVSVRRDGASRFGENERYGIFWSASIGWNLKEESFLSNADFLDKLKLVGSYGTLGNWDFGDYDAMGYYQFTGYNSEPSAIIKTSVSNPDLTWESQQSMNVGVEASFLNHRINSTVDYFVNTRTGFLFKNPLPYEGGGYDQWKNSGEMVSSGFEISLNGNIIQDSELIWNIGGNITIMDYDIKQLEQDQLVVSGISIIKEGEEPFTFYLPRYAGVNPSNGDALYYDKDGNVTNVYSSGDAVAISGKSPLAKMFGGFNTYLSYKGIDFNVDFSFKYGNYTYNYEALNMLSDGDNATDNQRKDALDYWKKPGDNILPRLNGNSNQTTDRFLQDASYLRLRNLSLGYSLPQKWVSKIKLSKIRIFAQGQNLLTWTKYEGNVGTSVGSGESQLGSTQDFVPGLYSLYSYPVLRTYLFGIEIKF